MAEPLAAAFLGPGSMPSLVVVDNKPYHDMGCMRHHGLNNDLKRPGLILLRKQHFRSRVFSKVNLVEENFGMNRGFGHIRQPQASIGARVRCGSFYYFYFYTTPQAVSFNPVLNT